MAVNNVVNIKIKAVENLSEKLDGIKKSTNSLKQSFSNFATSSVNASQRVTTAITGLGVATGYILKRMSDDFTNLQN